MEQQTKRSIFINVFAWISIIFSGFGILIGIMQNTMKIVSGIMMVAMVGLYLYLIKRLRSDEIKNEFV